MTQATIYPLDLASVLDEVQNDNYDPLSSKLNTMAKQAVHSFVETEFTGSCGRTESLHIQLESASVRRVEVVKERNFCPVEFSHTLLLYRAINLLRIKSRAARFYDSLTSDKTPPPHSTFLTEGTRSLRTVILIRHLQRILLDVRRRLFDDGCFSYSNLVLRRVCCGEVEIPSLPLEGDADRKRNDKGKGKGKKLQTMDPPDDGELGDERQETENEQQSDPATVRWLTQSLDDMLRFQCKRSVSIIHSFLGLPPGETAFATIFYKVMSGQFFRNVAEETFSQVSEIRELQLERNV
ncbi:hypothetical protein C8R41DRAFT_969360 [Lentinula lateritia]|uniref:Uncharacterized protein n=1 Tax=Lentinula lateritia TaxID=40482 RepID=A0ABQ8VTM4_9AGAR|nr:hypothetical protein C8R41DRAFT_969360 [Lentinula lateritia]